MKYNYPGLNARYEIRKRDNELDDLARSAGPCIVRQMNEEEIAKYGKPSNPKVITEPKPIHKPRTVDRERLYELVLEHGMSRKAQATVAEIMGIPEGTVRGLIHTYVKPRIGAQKAHESKEVSV